MPAPRKRFHVPDKLLERTRSSGRLGAVLAWAVVFADIGTSIYYVPGLLFKELGGTSPSPAAAFVLLTGVAFIFLALKYVNVAARYPDGGGVVSVASDAFGPVVGCLGGCLICTAYFLTGALSSVSGFEYLAAAVPGLRPWIPYAACLALIVLGALNLVGIRESALLTTFLAAGSLLVNLVVVIVVTVQLDAHRWQLVLDQFSAVRGLTTWQILVGYGSSWLAFSGLESISQIAPALQEPRERTALRAMLLVIACIFVMSPVITAYETALLDATKVNPDQFVYGLGVEYGPRWLGMAIVLTSCTLLVGAANTAIIGCYHVFLALVRLGFMPAWLSDRNLRFGTPHRAIVISVLVPVAVIAAARGDMTVLGHLYSFGLLGAFTLTSIGLDRVRWQERARGIGFWVGLVTTGFVVTAWAVSLVAKVHATVFGGGVTLLGFALAWAVRKGWIAGVKGGFVSADEAELAASKLESAVDVVTVDEVLAMRPMYSSSTLVAVRSPNLHLFQQALARARGSGDKAVYIIFVDEVPGLFFPINQGPSKEARHVLTASVDYFREAGMDAVPVWRMAHDAGASVAAAAKDLGVSAVMVGTSQRNALWHLLRGNVLKSLVRELPSETRVWICN